MGFSESQWSRAPVSKDGGGPMVRDAAHEAAESG